VGDAVEGVMRRLLTVLRVLWLLPVAIPVWLLYVLPLWGLGWLRLYMHPSLLGVAVFEVTPRAAGWYRRLWIGWGGCSLPLAIIVSPRRRGTTLAHELEHDCQWSELGPLFPVVYLVLLAIYGYERHPLEVMARRAEQ
jgi:hypothetical protein